MASKTSAPQKNKAGLACFIVIRPRRPREDAVLTESLEWYESIFLWLFATGIGIPPVPEEAGILYAAGLHALHPGVLWPFAWLACGLGILSADCVLYGIGRQWGRRLFMLKWVQRIINDQRRMQIEMKIHTHGMKLLLLARFLPPLRTGVFLISGASRFSFLKFIIADSMYCIFGVGLFFFAGTGILTLIKSIGYEAAWFVAVPVIGYALYRYFRSLKRRAEATPPVSVLQSPAGTAPPGESILNPAGAAQAASDAQEALKVPATNRNL
jgi:membrane protein DedA with SNARE-associated domain